MNEANVRMAFRPTEDSGRSGPVDVFIIGGGPAGLTAAYCLTKEASSVLVIEKDPDYVGGICRTIRHQGFEAAYHTIKT